MRERRAGRGVEEAGDPRHVVRQRRHGHDVGPAEPGGRGRVLLGGPEAAQPADGLAGVERGTGAVAEEFMAEDPRHPYVADRGELVLLAVVGRLQQQRQPAVDPVADEGVELLQQPAVHGVGLGRLQDEEGPLPSLGVLVGVQGEHTQQEAALGVHVDRGVEGVQAGVQCVQLHAEDAGGDVVDVEGVDGRVEQMPGVLDAVHDDLEVRVAGQDAGEGAEERQGEVLADDGAVGERAGRAGGRGGGGHGCASWWGAVGEDLGKGVHQGPEVADHGLRVGGGQQAQRRHGVGARGRVVDRHRRPVRERVLGDHGQLAARAERHAVVHRREVPDTPVRPGVTGAVDGQDDQGAGRAVRLLRRAGLGGPGDRAAQQVVGEHADQVEAEDLLDLRDGHRAAEPGGGLDHPHLPVGAELDLGVRTAVRAAPARRRPRAPGPRCAAGRRAAARRA